MVVQKVCIQARMQVGMINIANRHPKLHLFQAVTDFVKVDVGMSISNVYHPNLHSSLYAYFLHHHPYFFLQF